VGKRIANLRKIKGLSVPALAEKAKISKGYVWQLENGEEPNPSIGVLSQIADALDTTAAELLGQPTVKRKNSSNIPLIFPPGLQEFLNERKRRGEPVREDIVRALAQLEARGTKDWVFLYEAIQRGTKGDET
jgi:transcriptional regulator with XRE-family HTH domain